MYTWVVRFWEKSYIRTLVVTLDVAQRGKQFQIAYCFRATQNNFVHVNILKPAVKQPWATENALRMLNI